MSAGENGRTSDAVPKAIPTWAKDLVRGYVGHMEEVRNLMYLSRMGVALLQHVPLFLKTIGVRTPNEQETLEAVQRHAALTVSEVENDFPMLNGQAAVALWGSLESFVRSFVAQWVENNPKALSEKPFARLKVSLGEYAAMDTSDQARYVVDLLEQELGSSRKLGVNRFEVLLEALGMSGVVEEGIGRDLFELQQIRNVVVHQRGLADRRLREKCPWLEVKVGDPVRLKKADLDRYHDAVAKYSLTLVNRIRLRHGLTEYKIGEVDRPSQRDDNDPVAARTEPLSEET